MNFAARMAFLSLLMAAPAQAQDVGHERLETETSLFCDTPQQVERFVSLFNGDSISAEAAIATINAESERPDACVIATAAYRRAGTVLTVKNGDAAFDVVRIVVLGVYTINGFERSQPTELFSLMPHGDDQSGTIGRR
jgi:hypothetical protein